MKVWELVGTVADTIFRVVLLAAIVFVVYRGALTCYDYGYRIFTEEPMSATGGRDVTLDIPVDFTAKELGELFEANGLSRDGKLFMLQYYCSEYRKEVRGGHYTFNTTMTAEEMFEVMSKAAILESESPELLVLPEETGAGTEEAEEDVEQAGAQEVNMDGLDGLTGDTLQ